MTAVHDAAKRPPPFLIEDFEELASKTRDTVRLELIDGRIEVKPVPDGTHSEIVAWLQNACREQRADRWLYAGVGLRVGDGLTGRAIADGVLAPRGHFAGHGEWSDPEGIPMVVAVTSKYADAVRRDRTTKALGYAAAGIPLYLLVDRDRRMVTVYSKPWNGEYLSIRSRPYGESVRLPDPVGFTLPTEELKKATGD
ncbi:Uma2 family endonuclease [Streptomyces sp. AV19]|uniref:Uma2 family endonuclease n=1 Tax=Streptomyces sp. AV19 TaxID=2793068 RepID=UPI0018FE9941|nr:Uma2 family endonuclease [Streptomyces sp. AV19]MBH1936048.1 Uma2 family endonuclease [Streptomyces sp. AV19]MDG4534157.1 Uma2 family endonuclease [Streptomyces sp. AV19]